MSDALGPDETKAELPQLIAPSEPLPGHSGPPLEGHTAATAVTPPHASPLSGPALDEAAKHEFLWHTHEYLGEYARFADTKAAFAGTIASALIGALYSAKAHLALMQAPGEWTIAAWLTAAAGAFLIASIVLAVWTVLPRLRSTQSKGFVYWGAIANHGTVELLQTSFHSQSARTLNDHLLHHVFDISKKVCLPKYRAVTLCIWAVVIGGFLSAAALMVADIPPAVPSTSPSPAATTPVR